MAIDLDYVLAMGDGIASVAPTGTTQPTDMAALTTPWVDLGALSTDGFTQSIKQTRTDFKRWGSIAKIKSIVTDKAFTFTATFLESNPDVLGLYYGVTAPVPDVTSHIISLTPNSSSTQDHRSFVLDIMEGTNHVRWYLPDAEVTDTTDVPYKTDGMTQYGVTITAYPDADGNPFYGSLLLDAVVNA